MIEPGINLCNRCGTVSTELVYRSEKDPSLWQLVWDPARSEFVLKPRSAADKSSNPPSLANPLDITPEDFPPSTLEVRPLYGGEDNQIYHRACSKCGKIFDCDLIGKVRSYVIAVIGVTNAGKSSWVSAVSSDALTPLNLQQYPYKIFPAHFTTATGKIEATKPGTDGHTNYFIIGPNRNEPAALVYLLDYGGELYKEQRARDSTKPVGRLLQAKAGKGYPGLDAVVVIERAVSDNPTNSEQLLDTLNLIKQHNPDGFPIAHVLSYGDKLLEKESQKPITPDSIPLITANTFPRTAYTQQTARSLSRHYTPDAIWKRLQLHQAFSNCGEIREKLYLVFPSGNISHFIVQSCTYDREHEKNIYTTQFNVIDPLLWILHELQIFPLQLNTNWR